MRVWLLGVALVLLGQPLPADEVKKAEVKTFPVPYRLTDSNHIVVRTRINGKGPFNLAVDTGAPYLFVSTAAAQKAGVEPNKQGWGVFDRFEIEGGVVIEKARGRIDTLARLEAANSLGLIGVPIHGLIGYDILARYKIQLDLTRHKMTWIRLDFTPPPAEAQGGKGGEPAEVDAVANTMKVVGALLGNKPIELRPRGFLGIELADSDGGIVVKSVLANSPAAVAGLQANDRISHFRDKKVAGTAEFQRLAGILRSGDTVVLTVQRGTASESITVKVGKGL